MYLHIAAQAANPEGYPRVPPPLYKRKGKKEHLQELACFAEGLRYIRVHYINYIRSLKIPFQICPIQNLSKANTAGQINDRELVTLTRPNETAALQATEETKK